MFKKCLKYDLKETFKMWWPFVITSTITAGITGILMGFVVLNDASDPILALLTLPATLFWFLTVILIFVGYIIPYIRYYNHFFGKERYLTFTLPVKRSTLFGSKVLSGFLYTLLSVVIPIVLLSTIFILFSYFSDPQGLSEQLFEPFALAIVYLVLGVGGLLMSLLGSYLVITFCGVFFKKYSLFITIAAFYLLGNFGSFLLVLPMLSVFTFIGGAAGLWELGVVSVGDFKAGLLFLLALALTAVIMALINLLLAFLNMELLERKLNVI